LTAIAAFVLIVRVVVPLPGIDAGLKLQVASDGRPVHEVAPNWMLPGTPSTAVTVKVKVPDVPGLATVTVLAPAERAKSATAEEVDVM
jgi:hypothetical protein